MNGDASDGQVSFFMYQLPSASKSGSIIRLRPLKQAFCGHNIIE
jgi:hypothetical protein